MSGRRIEGLTGTQVAANALATVTAAIVASYLGIAGTIIGAAVASAATTAGTAVYRHYLGRTRERLLVATSGIVPKVAHSLGNPTEPLDPVRAEAHRESRAGSGPPDPAGAGETRPITTERIDPARAAARLTETREIGRFQPGSTSAGPGGDPGGADEPGAAAEDGPAGEPARAAGAGEAHGTDLPGRRGWPSRKGWLVLTGTALGVFLVTMAMITLVETATGKPLNAAIWQQHSSGTTVGDAVTGQPGHPRKASTPSPSQTPPATQGQSPSPSPTPAPATTSPSPAGSASPSASTPATSPAAPRRSTGTPASQAP